MSGRYSLELGKSNLPRFLGIETRAGINGGPVQAVFVEWLFPAFEVGNEPNDLAIARALMDFAPLSMTMAEQMSGLRNWA
jgi:hypothetical protein